MSYATQSDLVSLVSSTEELILLTDVTNDPPTTIAAATVSDALAKAEGEINGYIAVRVTTPVTPVPATLTQMVCQVARYRLWRDRASDRVRQDYLDAIAWAKGVGNGTIALGNAADTATDAPSPGAPQVAANNRRFTRTSMGDL